MLYRLSYRITAASRKFYQKSPGAGVAAIAGGRSRC